MLRMARSRIARARVAWSRAVVREQLALAPCVEHVAHAPGRGLPGRAEHLFERRGHAFPDLGPRRRGIAGPAHLQDDFLGRFVARAGHVEAARGDRRDPERVPQHVVDDVVVGVVEFEPAAALGAVVGPQGQVQQLVRKHEHEIVAGEPGRKGRIGNQAAGRENAHRRHAIVEIDTHRCGQAGKVRQRHGDHPQRPHDTGARRAIGRRRWRRAAHAVATFRKSSSIARSAPREPHFSTISVSSVS